MASLPEAVQKPVTLGERVRDRRAGLKLTQQDLGDRCGLHRTFIGSVERGERNVSILNLRQMARALRTEPMFLQVACARFGQAR